MFRLLATENFTGDTFEGFVGPTATMDTHSFLMDSQSGRKILKFTNIPTRVYPRAHFPRRFGPSTWVAADVQLERSDNPPMTVEQWSAPDMLLKASDVIKTISMTINTEVEYKSASYLTNGTPILTESSRKTWTKFKAGRFTIPAQFFADGELQQEMFPQGIRELFPEATTRASIYDFVIQQRRLFTIHKELGELSKKAVTAGQAIGAMPAAAPGYVLAAIAAISAGSPDQQTEEKEAAAALPVSPTVEEASTPAPMDCIENVTPATSSTQTKVRQDTPYPLDQPGPSGLQSGAAAFGPAAKRNTVIPNWPVTVDGARPYNIAITIRNNDSSPSFGFNDMSIIAEDPAIEAASKVTRVSPPRPARPPTTPTSSPSTPRTTKRGQTLSSIEVQDFAKRFAQASATSRPGKSSVPSPKTKKQDNPRAKRVTFKVTPTKRKTPTKVHPAFQQPAGTCRTEANRNRKDSTDSEDPDKTA